MARSGGFNVPADYFRSSAMPAPVPATPAGVPGRKRWPLYLAMAAVGSAIGVGAIVLVMSGRTTSAAPTANAQPPAAQTAVTQTQAPVTAPPATSTAAVAPSAPVSSAAVAPAPMKEVLIVTSTPSDANISKNGVVIGPAPQSIPIGDSEELSLTLSKDGFVSQTVKVKLSGGNRQVFKLKPDTKAIFRNPPNANTAAPPPTTAKATNTGGLDALPVPKVFGGH